MGGGGGGLHLVAKNSYGEVSVVPKLTHPLLRSIGHNITTRCVSKIFNQRLRFALRCVYAACHIEHAISLLGCVKLATQ